MTKDIHECHSLSLQFYLSGVLVSVRICAFLPNSNKTCTRKTSYANLTEHLGRRRTTAGDHADLSRQQLKRDMRDSPSRDAMKLFRRLAKMSNQSATADTIANEIVGLHTSPVITFY